MKRRGIYLFAFTVCGAATVGLFVARGPEPSKSVLRRLFQRRQMLTLKKGSIEDHIQKLIGECMDEDRFILESIIKENLDIEPFVSPHQQGRYDRIDQLQPELDECEAEIEEILDEMAIDAAKRDGLVRRRAVFTGAASFTGILSATFLILFLAIKKPLASATPMI